MQKFGSHLENLQVFLWFMTILMKLITRVRDSSLCLTRWSGLKTLKNDFIKNYCYLTNISGYFFLYNKITNNLFFFFFFFLVL